jgi:hypothetical protein
MTDTVTADVRCDTCNGLHHLHLPIAASQDEYDAANLFLIAMGWETYEQRSDGQLRHRCTACVRLRDRLTEVQRKQDQLSRMLDGHS